MNAQKKTLRQVAESCFPIPMGIDGRRKITRIAYENGYMPEKLFEEIAEIRYEDWCDSEA